MRAWRARPAGGGVQQAWRPPLRFPAAGRRRGELEESRPGYRVRGRGQGVVHQMRLASKWPSDRFRRSIGVPPDAIALESLGSADPVIAPDAATVPQLQILQLPGGGFGDEARSTGIPRRRPGTPGRHLLRDGVARRERAPASASGLTNRPGFGWRRAAL